MSAAHDNPASVKWETIRDDGSLANEPGSGVRLTIECTAHRSQVKNKAEVAAEMRRILGLKPYSLVRESPDGLPD